MSQVEFQDPGATLSIERGVIRAGQAHVTIRLQATQVIVIHLVALDSCGDTIGTWPARSIDQGADAAGPFTVFFVQSELIAGHVPVQRFTVRTDTPNHRLQYGAGFELSLLFYANDKDFKRSQIARRRGNRPLDQETQMFLARQMVEAHFVTLDQSLELPASMAATYAYRATDIDDDGSARDAIGYIDQLIAHIEALPPSDFNQAWVMSLMTAKWHAAATLRDVDLFENTLLYGITNIDSLCANSILLYNVL